MHLLTEHLQRQKSVIHTKLPLQHSKKCICCYITGRVQEKPSESVQKLSCCFTSFRCIIVAPILSWPALCLFLFRPWPTQPSLLRSSEMCTAPTLKYGCSVSCEFAAFQILLYCKIVLINIFFVNSVHLNDQLSSNGVILEWDFGYLI